jgi:hypothetical protein
MTDTSTPPSKQDVYDALSELKKGRSRSRAYIAIKGILYRYGDGVKHINELDPKYYAAVIAAVTIPTIPTAADIYGTVTDVQPRNFNPTSPAQARAARPMLVLREPASQPAPPITRIRSPMALALEAELAKVLAKTRRSAPNYTVNAGNASRAEDQDDSAVQDFPAGERVS